MDLSRLLLYFLDYLIVLPAAFMCILPVLDHGKIKKTPAVILAAAAATFVPIPMAFIRAVTKADANLPLFAFMAVFFVAYLLLFDVKKAKLWYLFISTTAVFSFGGLSTHFVEAMSDDPNDEWISLAVKWGISLLFLIAEIIFLKKLTWLFDNGDIDTVWRFVWAVPMIITAANLFMIPENYEFVRIGRVFQEYVMVEIMLTLFFTVFLVMQYTIAHAVTNRAEAEQNAHILGLQAAQYENLKKYMDSSARLRHDFIYMAKTAQTLAANGETEQLQKLLEDYGAKIDANAAPPKYCEHTALNAITAYYAREAREANIGFTAKLNLPQSIIISDYELCSVAGNILDNAVAAAKEAGTDKPEILFVADTKPNGDLYLAVSNPYSGFVREENKKYTSTKSEGHGIGLESVKAIVGKNRGYCNFRYDGRTFYSEIMLRQG